MAENTEIKSEDDVFEAVYNQYTSPQQEQQEKPADEEKKDPPVEKPKAEEEKKEEVASSPPPKEQEQKPFSFEEDKLYPVPGKSGIEYVPYPKLKRLVEQGRGAAKLIEESKKREIELREAIAISESISDIPAEARTALFEELGKAVDKHREALKLGKKFEQTTSALPKKYQDFLDKQIEQSANKEKEEVIQKSLTKLRENVTEVCRFAKEHFGHDIAEDEGEMIRREANIVSERTGIGLDYIDLVGIYTRLFPSRLKAQKVAEMESKGQVKKEQIPVVAPKSAPQPKGKTKKKMAEYSQSELNDMPREEREELVMENLKELHGR